MPGKRSASRSPANLDHRECGRTQIALNLTGGNPERSSKPAAALPYCRQAVKGYPGTDEATPAATRAKAIGSQRAGSPPGRGCDVPGRRTRPALRARVLAELGGGREKL